MSVISLSGRRLGALIFVSSLLSAGSALAQEPIIVKCTPAAGSHHAAASEIDKTFKIDYSAQSWWSWDAAGGAWRQQACNRQYGSGSDVTIWTCDFDPTRFRYNRRDGAFVEYELVIDRTNGTVSYRGSNHRDGSSYTGMGTCSRTAEPAPPATIF